MRPIQISLERVYRDPRMLSIEARGRENQWLLVNQSGTHADISSRSGSAVCQSNLHQPHSTTSVQAYQWSRRLDVFGLNWGRNSDILMGVGIQELNTTR